MVRLPRRTLVHWTPDLGDRDSWLEELRAAGWVPEYPWEPEPVIVNGRTVWPWALIDVDSFERGLAYRQPGATAPDSR